MHCGIRRLILWALLSSTNTHCSKPLFFVKKKSTLRTTYILMNFDFWTQFDTRFWIWNAQKKDEFRIFGQKSVKIGFFYCFLSPILGQKSRFLSGKFNFLILFRIKYSRIHSDFGAKIQICLKVKFYQNWFFLEKNATFGIVCNNSWRYRKQINRETSTDDDASKVIHLLSN